MSIEIIISVLFVILLSSVFRAIFGFGDALIAMPLLVLLIPVTTATPLIAIISLIIAVSIIYKDWKLINLGKVKYLIIYTILGIPLGLLYLDKANESMVKIVLGIMLILFSLFQLFSKGVFKLKTEKLSWLFGFISGVLGGAYNTNGPPIIIYGSLRDWEPKEFRAILQSVFIPTNMFIVAGHGIAGFWSSEVFELLLYCSPIILFSVLIGNKIHSKIPQKNFDSIVYLSLIAISVFLIVNSI